MDRVEKAQVLFDQLHDEEILKDDLELQSIMKNYIYGDVYHHGSLELKERELILIVVNTTNHTLKALKEHLIAGLKVGLSPESIKEAIYQCTPYIGLGKVQEALDIVNDVFQLKQITTKAEATVNEETRFEKGFAVQCEAFGTDNIRSNHENAPLELKHIQNYLSAYCFGDFYTRKGLDLKERERLTFVILATLGGCENQLRAHTGANLQVGNTREILIETITQCQPYIGFPRTLNAIQIINEVAKQ